MTLASFQTMLHPYNYSLTFCPFLQTNSALRGGVSYRDVVVVTHNTE